jgi:histone-lysine N-methyltransferase SETMAR
VAVIHNVDFEIFQQPSYSPDLAPSDYFPFPKLKERLPGTHFSDDEQVITSANEGLAERDKYFFSKGIKASCASIC